MRIRNVVRVLTITGLISIGSVVTSQPALASGDPGCFVHQGDDDNYTVFSHGNGLPWPQEEVKYVDWKVDQSWNPFDLKYRVHGTHTTYIGVNWDSIDATITKRNGMRITCDGL